MRRGTREKTQKCWKDNLSAEKQLFLLLSESNKKQEILEQKRKAENERFLAKRSGRLQSLP